MLEKYNSEIEGMIDFWREIGLDPDYELNTDGRFNGNLIEFKLVFQDLRKHKEQIRRYIRAYNSCALPIPKYSYLISINERKYIKINNENGNEIKSGDYIDAVDFKDEFLSQNEYIKGWIDEFSIRSYNNKICNEYKRFFKSKESVKNEFINPQYLNIKPFNWDKQLELEENDNDSVGWLHFNMNLLGPALLQKQLGAFFTPDMYVKISTEMVREAIERVPEGNDYIILDRCAGTGNLEKFFTEEELSHCVLNTYDYTEWATLKGLYDGRVKMIIPPTHQSIDYNNGLLLYGDALGEDFHKFCFGSKIIGLFDDAYKKQSEQLSSWLKDEKMTIIMLENPPFVEPQGGASQGKATFSIKNKYMYQVMGRERFDSKNVNRATENLFIWSAFKYFLKQPTDSYILFSPIKYWKSQHIIDKKFIRGYICNRENFNASEGGILLIEWTNENFNNEELQVSSDLGSRIIKKIKSNPSILLKDSESNEDPIAWLFNLSNIPKNDNGKIVNIVNENYRKVQKAYKLSEDNILTQLPLWLANCYEYKDYTEKEVIMKTGDLSDKYTTDTEFLIDSFVWATLSNKNKCISNENISNQFCILQKTKSDKILKDLKLNNNNKKLIKLWEKVLKLAKATDEYNENWTYGLYQIEHDINIKVGSGTYNKKGEELKKPKYRRLDEQINILKIELKKYYDEILKPKLFEYELLK